MRIRHTAAIGAGMMLFAGGALARWAATCFSAPVHARGTLDTNAEVRRPGCLHMDNDPDLLRDGPESRRQQQLSLAS
jgi:hypothetical protein